MKRYIGSLAVVLSIAMSGCVQTGSSLRESPATKSEKPAPQAKGKEEKSLIIENVSVSRKTVSLEKKEKVSILYRLASEAGEVRVTFYNSVNQPVREMLYSSVPAGKQSIEWDGKTEKGENCEADVYTFTITAKRGDRQFTYNPALETGNRHLKVEEVFWDKEKGEVVYILPQAAWARVRLGLTKGALLKTLMEWMPQEAGRHTLAWDGWDQDKLITFSSDPRVAIAVESYSIPSNSIIITGGKVPDYSERHKWLVSGKVSTYPLNILAKVHIYEPKFSLSLPDNTVRNEKGLPVVSGKVSVMVNIDPKDREILVNSRYELMYFVDTVFIYEDEQAYDPFTYIWDTTGLKEGEHIFTVNLLGYNMSVGINSIKVYVKEQEKAEVNKNSAQTN